MKFAFICMGAQQGDEEHAVLQNGRMQIVSVFDVAQACTVAQKLCAQGVGCIELCGGFGTDGAKRVIEATQNKIPIGYVTHLPEQEEVYQAAFASES